MSDVANPSSSASTAAQQVIIELIKAGKIGFYDAETTAGVINDFYEKLVDGYRKTNSRQSK